MTKGLKIALVSAFPPGVQSLTEYGYHLAINFAADPRVDQVVVIADKLHNPQAELELDAKIRVVRVWDFNRLSNAKAILSTLRTEAPDLALFNVQTASFGDKELPAALGLMTPWLARLRGTYSGIIAHNMISGVDLDSTKLKGQKLRQQIVKLGGYIVTALMMRANYITVTLESYYEEFRTKFPKANIHFVGHGTFDTDSRAYEPFEARDDIIVTMGKFGTYKRLETLIDAVDIVRRGPQYKDLKVIIGGTNHPNAQGYMEEVEATHNGESHLQFHGYVAEEDIPSFFSQAKIAVFDYSHTTGSSGVLHQTASYGAVPVFPHIGDFVDVCKNEGILGVNYKVNDAVDMAKAIENVLSHPKNSENIAQTNRKAAEAMPFSDVIGFHIAQVSARL